MLCEMLVVGPLQCNCAILGDEKTREALVIDPGGEPDRILGVLRGHGLTLKAILHTHAHFDHLGATHALHQATGAPVYLHPEDRPLWDGLYLQTALFGMPPVRVPSVDAWMTDGDQIQAGEVQAQVLHTPGHSPGSVCFLLEQAGMVFTGDTLFRDGIGRTDLWGGSLSAILRSIRERLLTLDPDTRVYPGHGPATTIGREREQNPFLQLKERF